MLLICASILDRTIADILKSKCALTSLSHLQENEPHIASCQIRRCFLHFAIGDVIIEEVTGLVNVLKDSQNVDEINIVDWLRSD